MLEAGWGKPGTERGRHWDSLMALAALVRGETVLDIACGQGHFYAVLGAEKISDYLGVDNSEDMLAKAREAFPYSDDCFIKGDAYDLPSTIGYYDTVMMIDLLMHLPKIDAPIHQAWHKTGMELIIAHQIARKHALTQTPFSGKVPLPEGKFLINRYDTPSTMFEIFCTLPNVKSIEQFYYDERMQIYRLTKGIPSWGSFRDGWRNL
jgi:SAM-dependent methyltransferase